MLKSLRCFLLAILCWLNRTERDLVIQMSFLISVGIRYHHDGEQLRRSQWKALGLL